MINEQKTRMYKSYRIKKYVVIKLDVQCLFSTVQLYSRI